MVETQILSPVITGSLSGAQLVRFWHYLGQLRRVAAECETNFVWLIFSKAKAIHFLDADVIYGALPTFSSAKAVEETSLLRAEASLLPDISRYSGVHTVRWYLNELKDFCLPIGSMIEVIQAHNRLTKSTERPARVIQRCFDAIDSKRSYSEIAEIVAGEHISDALRDNLLHVAERVDEVQLLNDLLERSLDAESLGAGREPDAAADEAYRLILGVLDQERSSKRREANLRDALNAGTVVQVFNRANSLREEPLLPVLISTTKALLNNGRILEERLRVPRSPFKKPQVLAERLYLFLSRAVLSHVGEDHFQIGLDYVRNLQKDCQRLAEFVEDILPSPVGGLLDSDEPLTIDESLRDHFMDLASRFTEDWSQLLFPFVRTRQFDRVAYINQLFSQDVKRLLGSSQALDRKRGIQSLKDRLRGGSLPQDFWKIIQRYATDEPPKASLELSVPLFSLTLGNCDGAPLALSQPGQLLRPRWTAPKDQNMANALDPSPAEKRYNETLELLETYHELRLLIHVHSGYGGALVAVDSLWEENGAGREIRFTWRHVNDFERIWISGIDLMEMFLISAGVASDNLSVRLFKREGFELIEDIDLVSLKEWPIDPAELSYFELYSGSCALFADVQPIEEVELQAGLVFPADFWSAAFVANEPFLRVLADTNEQQLGQKRWRELLELLSPFLRAPSDSVQNI